MYMNNLDQYDTRRVLIRNCLVLLDASSASAQTVYAAYS
jgi:hypothetical protein